MTAVSSSGHRRRRGVDVPAAGGTAGYSPLPAVKMLRTGNHVAPFRSRAGNPVLLVIWRGDAGAQLFAMGEVTAMQAYEFWTSTRGKRSGDHLTFIPADERLLPRGVHRAPWRIGGRYDPKCEVLLAIDGQHRLVEMLTIEPGEASEQEAVRFLLALLDTQEETEAELEAARDANDPRPLPYFRGAHTLIPRDHEGRKVRGIWSCYNRTFFFVTGAGAHAATLEFHGSFEQSASLFGLTRLLRRLMVWLDPSGTSIDDDDDLSGDEWKRA